jgi:type IV secretory pathway VirB10-like protein
VVEQLAEQSKVELKTEPVAVEALAETKVETEAQKALEQDAPPPTLNPNPQLDLENSEPTAPLPETGKQTDPPKDKVEDMPVTPPEATPPPQPTPPAQEDNAKKEEDKKDPDVKKDSSSDLMKIANLFPYVEWTTDEKSPQLIGRAAEFVESNNTILANQNFKGFQDLSKYFESKYGDSPEASLQIKICVAEFIEQVLMECTAGILSLKDQPHWNPYQINQGLTKEALTASVMQRYWLVEQIDKELKSRIKSEENS